MSHFLQQTNAGFCPEFSLRNQAFEPNGQDVKIAYYNDNNTKRRWQKSALFAIGNGISQAFGLSSTRRLIYKIDCYMKQNYSVSFPAFNTKCWQVISLFFFLVFSAVN